MTVAGKGEVAARPNLLEIDLEVVAASELTADAIVKYRDARRKIQEAFAALKLENISVGERGLLVNKKGAMNSRYFFSGYEQNTRAKTEVQLSRKLVVKGTDIRKLDEDALLQLTAKLLDVAQDAGARVGGSNDFDLDYFYYGYPRRSEGLVRFVLEDFEKLQEEAYEKAIADARSRAQRLARLSRVELGPIVAVQEIFVPGETQHRPGWRRGRTPQAAGGVEIPGDPDPGRAPGAVRGPSEGRGQGTGGELMNMRRFPTTARSHTVSRLPQAARLPTPLARVGRCQSCDWLSVRTRA